MYLMTNTNPVDENVEIIILLQMSRDSHVISQLLTVTAHWQIPADQYDGVKRFDDSKTCQIYTRPDVFWLFSGLLETSDTYRQSAIKYWTLDNTVKTFLIIYPWIPASSSLDKTGCSLASSLLWRVIEQEEALHWLSTLGGAFSNLGEASQDFAQRAGHNALKQLVLGSSSGDMSVVAKCQLFIAHSQMQLGRLREAARLVRLVWRLCHSQPLCSLAITEKLLTMCQGVWSRIKYERRRQMVTDQEVEQKFSVPYNYRDILESVGAVKKSEKVINDEYLDTHDFQLMRMDHWLRRRGEKYELKIPPIDKVHQRDGVGLTQYREVEGEEEVQPVIYKLLNMNLEDLTSLVKISAVRETFNFEDFTISVDRIQDDNWSVGEIELMARSDADMQKVKKRIKNMGQKLKFTPQQAGKVTHCLKVQNPEASQILMTLNQMK